MMQSNDKILEIFKGCGALLEGHFILASGKHSANYVQVALLAQYPRRLISLLFDKAFELQNRIKIDTVLSAAIGGIPVGQELGALFDCKAIFAERDNNNKMVLKRGFTIKNDERILLVEDVMTTGGTIDELKDIVIQNKGIIAGIFTIVNRTGKKYLGEYKIESIIELNFPVYNQDECPLCKQGIPAERPGTKKMI
ncbi:MAG: orotate phosphoribosyltransferase [Candidatus Hydrogenedentota bacterium]